MVLHHEAAILMAEEQLRTGTNQEMKTTAQAIITKQRAEIAQFNAFLNGHQPMPPLVSQFNQLQKTNMDKMMAASDARSMTGKPDVDFAQLMVDHHQAASTTPRPCCSTGATPPLAPWPRPLLPTSARKLRRSRIGSRAIVSPGLPTNKGSSQRAAFLRLGCW